MTGQIKKAFLLLILCLAAIVMSVEIYKEQALDVFFDLRLMRTSAGIVSFPAQMKFIEIAQRIVELHSPNSSSEQVIFTHRNIPLTVSIGAEVTPAMLGLEGYISSFEQPRGTIKVTMGYKVFLAVNKNQKTAIALDLDKEVGEWISQSVDTLNEVGLLYINSEIVSSLTSLRKAFSGLANESNFEIRGDIVIKISEECRIIGVDGQVLITRIAEVDTLEAVLNRIGQLVTDIDLLSLKMICMDPTCQKKITDMKAQFTNYELAQYQVLYIPGPVKIQVGLESTGKETRFSLERNTTVEQFITVIKDSLFNKDYYIHIALHPIGPVDDFIIDSVNTEENESIYLVNLGVYKFKITIEKPIECAVEMESNLKDLVTGNFTGSYPCSTTLEEIHIAAHKYFSSPYSYRLYDNDDQILKYPPGLIVPEYIPEDRRSSDLTSLPIEIFKVKGSSKASFKYNYQLILRIEETKSSVPSPSEIHFFIFPLSSPARVLKSTIDKFGQYSFTRIPIPLSDPSPLAVYYASYSDLYSSSEYLDLYASLSVGLRFPGLYYQIYPGSLYLTIQHIRFYGDFTYSSDVGVYFTPQMRKSDFEMVVRRWLATANPLPWSKRGPHAVALGNPRIKGHPLGEWKQGEALRSWLEREVGEGMQVLEIEVRRKEED